MSSASNITSAPAPVVDDAGRSAKRNGTPAWWIVAKREMAVKLRDKAFIIGTLSSLGLVAIAMVLGAVLAPKGGSNLVPVAVADEKSAAMVQSVADYATEHSNLRIETVRADSPESAKSTVDEGGAAVFVEPDGQGWKIWTLDEPNETFTEIFSAALQAEVTKQLAQRSGVDMQEVDARLRVNTDFIQAPSQGKFASMLVGLAFALIFMLSAWIYGMQIATSVIEEKQSRIVEILVSAIPIRHLLVGKILGISLIAFAQVLILLVAALVGIAFTPISHMLPDFIRASAWFMLFFMAGFIALATLWAASGALGTRSEDLNQTSQPLIWILMIAYLFGFMATGTTRVIASYVPIVSAILMPARIAEGGVAWWETLLALALNIAFAAITIYLGAKIYRRALLQTGGRLSYREAIKLAD